MYLRKKDKLMSQMEALYEAHYQRLFLYALTFLDHEDEAKDAVSDVFSTVWEQWERKGGADKVNLSYLYTLTRNHCLDLLRRDPRHQPRRLCA